MVIARQGKVAHADAQRTLDIERRNPREHGVAGMPVWRLTADRSAPAPEIL
jgi:hypothetical protein